MMRPLKGEADGTGMVPGLIHSAVVVKTWLSGNDTQDSKLFYFGPLETIASELVSDYEKGGRDLRHGNVTTVLFLEAPFDAASTMTFKDPLRAVMEGVELGRLSSEERRKAVEEAFRRRIRRHHLKGNCDRASGIKGWI